MTREQVSLMAIQAGFPHHLVEAATDMEIQRLAALILNERERCACICEDHFSSDGDWCAKQIRQS